MTLPIQSCNPSCAGDAISIGAATFRQLNKVLVRGIAVVLAIHEGLWLGLLRERSLQTVTRTGYGAQGRFRSEDHNRSGWFDWERNAIEKYFPRDAAVVVAGAGGGREALALVERGSHVVAFDSDERLIAACRSRLRSAEAAHLELYVAAPNSVPGEIKRSFAAGIVGWGALSHMTSAPARAAFLREFVALLDPGAPLLISFQCRPPQSGLDALRYGIARCIAAMTFGRKPEQGDRFRIEDESSFLHLFSSAEARAVIEGAGCSVLQLAEQPEAHCVAVKNRP